MISSETIAQHMMAHILGLTSEQAEQIASLAEERSYASGEMLFSEGDPANDLFFILEGRVFLGASFPHYSGRVNIASIGQSEFFGWSAVVGPYQETASAMAMRSTKILAINGPKLIGLCEHDPALGFAVMRTLLVAVADRLRATRERMFAIFSPREVEKILTSCEC